MCCFTRPVESVANTRIFARDSRAMMQFIAYQMEFSASEDVAMILPLPVSNRTSEKSVRFVNLEKYPSFFRNMESGFVLNDLESKGRSGSGAMGGSKRLKVIDVGSFEASYVPTLKDFARLDERFRLPNGTWEHVPQYANYGFAVFKLKKGEREIHPIAFEFPRADRTRLFFPTVHVHDGKVHEEAEFDHVLYAQRFPERDLRPLHSWTESQRPAGTFMNIAQSEGLILRNSHIYKHTIQGTHTNVDVFV